MEKGLVTSNTKRNAAIANRSRIRICTKEAALTVGLLAVGI